jgi:hypothetical protein
MALLITFLIGIVTGVLGNALYYNYLTWGEKSAVACDILVEVNKNNVEVRSRGVVAYFITHGTPRPPLDKKRLFELLNDAKRFHQFGRSAFLMRASSVHVLGPTLGQEIRRLYTTYDGLENYEGFYMSALQGTNRFDEDGKIMAHLLERYQGARTLGDKVADDLRALCKKPHPDDWRRG